MSAKIFDLQCSMHLSRTLAAAIRSYVAIHYPHGVADCAQAAREALLGVAQDIETVCQGHERVSLSRRLRTLLKLAVNEYCDLQAASVEIEQARAALLAALQGEVVNDALFATLT
jgi:hypothetical protein